MPDLFLVSLCSPSLAFILTSLSSGEDALANLSVEQLEGGKIEGFIRIRAKTQGIALSLGDKVTSEQKTNKKTEQHFDLEEYVYCPPPVVCANIFFFPLRAQKELGTTSN